MQEDIPRKYHYKMYYNHVMFIEKFKTKLMLQMFHQTQGDPNKGTFIHYIFILDINYYIFDN